MINNKYLHPDYIKMQSRWEKCRDAAAGEHDVHIKREVHLPKLEQETEESYKMRLMSSPFFEATWRTIITLRGMLFRKEPVSEFPDEMAEDIKNIDYTGKSLISFAQDVSLEALTVGRCGVLTDYTSVPDDITAADAVNIGARAFLRMYTAENILNWSHVNIGGKKELSMVRLLEDESGYSDITLKQGEQLHKLLLIESGRYVQRLMIVDSAGDEIQINDDIIPRMGGKTLSFIPFQAIGVDSLDMRVEIPPLIGLVSLNFHHYRQSSFYERGTSIAALPTLMVYGNSDENKTIYIGGATANSFPDPSTRAEYLSANNDFGAIERGLAKKEWQMSVMGAKMLEPKTAGVESGEAWARKQSGDESILADIATTISAGMTKSLKWFADWQGYKSDDIRFELTKDFLPFAMDSSQIQSLFSAYIGGALSYDALYYNYQRAGLYPPGTTIEDERGKIEESTPGMPTL